ncbi:hypothetical protein [Agrobacterium vitis]|nr:hypothetical protein [Agrobacterium vitis]
MQHWLDNLAEIEDDACILKQGLADVDEHFGVEGYACLQSQRK